MRLKVSALPKNPSLPHHFVRRNIRGCRGSSPAARGSRDEARTIADKHVIVGNSSYEPIPAGGSLAAPVDSTRIATVLVPIGADCGLTVP